MTRVTSKDAQNRFGELIDKAQREPVVIERRGRPVAVVMSMEDFERFEALEDAIWLEKAREAEKSGFLGLDESARVLERMLNAQD